MQRVRSAAVCAAAVTVLAAAGCSSAGPARPLPTLGRLAGVFSHGEGLGKVRPGTIFNGGDPTGLVEHITWTSWGGPRATGKGRAVWVGPHEDVAQGHFEPVTIVAFGLGSCHGKRMYEAVEWYFPEHGESFTARRYENVCAGSYVPAT